MTNTFPGQPERRDGLDGSTPLHDETASTFGQPNPLETDPTRARPAQTVFDDAQGLGTAAQRDYRPAPIPGTPGGDPSASQPDGKGDAAKQEAQRVGGEAKDAASQLAASAKEEVKSVASDAKAQAKSLFDQAKSTADQQARAQHERAASGIRSLSEDMHRVAGGVQPENELVTKAAQQLAATAGKAASWLEEREPQDLLAEAQRFARRNPVTFLAIAAGLGLVAGRVTRGLVGNPDLGGSSDEATATTRTTSPSTFGDAPRPAPGYAPLADSYTAPAQADPYAARAQAEAEMPAPNVPSHFGSGEQATRSPFEDGLR